MNFRELDALVWPNVDKIPRSVNIIYARALRQRPGMESTIEDFREFLEQLKLAGELNDDNTVVSSEDRVYRYLRNLYTRYDIKVKTAREPRALRNMCVDHMLHY